MSTSRHIPVLGDEAIEESGVKVFMAVLALGIGSARGRFESRVSELWEPNAMGHAKPGTRRTIFNLSGNYSFTQVPRQCGIG